MSNFNWLKITPVSGKGNGVIQNLAQEHTGRLERIAEVVISSSKIKGSKKYTVIQKPKPEFIQVDDDRFIVNKEGGVLTIEGKSNSESLRFQWIETDVSGYIPIELPKTYSVDDTNVNNGEYIKGDKGAEEEYRFSIQLEFPENTGLESIRLLRVTASSFDIKDPVYKTLIIIQEGTNTNGGRANTEDFDYRIDCETSDSDFDPFLDILLDGGKLNEE